MWPAGLRLHEGESAVVLLEERRGETPRRLVLHGRHIYIYIQETLMIILSPSPSHSLFASLTSARALFQATDEGGLDRSKCPVRMLISPSTFLLWLPMGGS